MDSNSQRLTGAEVYVLSGTKKSLCGTLPSTKDKKILEISCSGKPGTKVTIKIPGADKTLQLCEVQVLGKAEAGTGNLSK